MSPLRRIRDAAVALGTTVHVLRHWEDVGLLAPPRLSSGHRVYDQETIDRARMIQVCQRAGLSLSDIRALRAGDHADRIEHIAAQRATIARQVADLAAADRFLAHIGECVHAVVSECPECSELVGAGRASGEPSGPRRS